MVAMGLSVVARAFSARVGRCWRWLRISIRPVTSALRAEQEPFRIGFGRGLRDG